MRTTRGSKNYNKTLEKQENDKLKLVGFKITFIELELAMTFLIKEVFYFSGGNWRKSVEIFIV